MNAPEDPRVKALERAVMLGVAMRAAQARYFANRNPTNLDASKRIEREFDRAAEEALRKDHLL